MSLNHRLTYALGDLLANGGSGALVGWAVAAALPPSWGMTPAMLTGMALGMLLGMLLMVPLTILLGAMEVMIPLMLATMLSGMGVAMARSMGHLPPGDEPLAGAGLGVAALLFTWFMQWRLQGEVPHG